MIMMFIIIIIIVIVCTFHGYLKVLVRMKHGGGDLPDWLLHIDVKYQHRHLTSKKIKYVPVNR